MILEWRPDARPRPPGARIRRGSIRVTTGGSSNDRRQDREGHGTGSRTRSPGVRARRTPRRGEEGREKGREEGGAEEGREQGRGRCRKDGHERRRARRRSRTGKPGPPPRLHPRAACHQGLGRKRRGGCRRCRDGPVSEGDPGRPRGRSGGCGRSRGAAPAREPGSSIDRPRPPGPMHPGAVMESMQEQSGGLGGLLALWGPLIIVGFLVLVFRGGDDPETAVATAADATEPAPVDATAVSRARGRALRRPRGEPRRRSKAGSPCARPWRVRRPSPVAVPSPGGRRSRPERSIRRRPVPIAIRDTAACPPARAGPRKAPASGCGPPTFGRTRGRRTAAMRRCGGCGARPRTTGVRLRAALPGRSDLAPFRGVPAPPGIVRRSGANCPVTDSRLRAI